MPLPLSYQVSDAAINSSDRLCDYFQKLASQSKQVSDTYAEIYDSGGNLKQEFLDKICTVSSPLDCSGLPTDPPSGSSSSSSTSSSTPAPSLLFPDLYGFVVSYDGTDYSSKVRTFSGSEFDATGRFGNPTATASLPDNKTVVASALHPGTGEVYIIYIDGTKDFGYDLTLATVNPSTGAVSDIGLVRSPSKVLQLDSSSPILTFRPSDNQLRLMSGPTYTLSKYAFDVDLTTGEVAADAAVGWPAELSGILPMSMVTLSDDTPYVLGNFSGLYRVLTHSYEKDPYTTAYYADQVAGGVFQQATARPRATLVIRSGSAYILSHTANTFQTTNNTLLKANVSSDSIVDPATSPVLSLVQQDAASMKEIHSLAYLPS